MLISMVLRYIYIIQFSGTYSFENKHISLNIEETTLLVKRLPILECKQITPVHLNKVIIAYALQQKNIIWIMSFAF